MTGSSQSRSDGDGECARRDLGCGRLERPGMAGGESHLYLLRQSVAWQRGLLSWPPPRTNPTPMLCPSAHAHLPPAPRLSRFALRLACPLKQPQALHSMGQNGTPSDPPAPEVVEGTSVGFGGTPRLPPQGKLKRVPLSCTGGGSVGGAPVGGNAN